MVASEMYRVMAIDALTSSHPLSFEEDEINSPAEISEVFDSIAYSKVRMSRDNVSSSWRLPSPT